MRASRQWCISLAIVVALLFSGLGVGPALAAPVTPATDTEVQFTGTVIGVDAEGGTLQVQVQVGEGQTATYTVRAPAGMDLVGFTIGDTVQVQGTLDDQGVISATAITLGSSEEPTETPTEVETSEVTETPTEAETPEPGETPTVEETPEATLTPTPEETQTSPVTPTVPVSGTVTPVGTPGTDKGNRFCWDQTRVHPMAQGIARTYGVSYEQIMTWFCQGRFGFGQIILALQTAAITGQPADTYLNKRIKEGGWGKIWRDLGLLGKGKKKGAPATPPAPLTTVAGTPAPTATGEPTVGATPTAAPRLQGKKATQRSDVWQPQATLRPTKAPAQGKNASGRGAVSSPTRSAGKLQGGNSGQVSGSTRNTGRPQNSGSGQGNGSSNSTGKPESPGQGKGSGKR